MHMNKQFNEIEKIQIEIEKCKGCEDLPLPKPASIHASGFDLFAADVKSIIVKKGEIKLISTGIKIAIPIGYEAQIRPRSGLAFRNGITVLNSPGTIDSDYRGIIKIIIINLGSDNFTINRGDRIAQMVIHKIYHPVLIETSKLNKTKRGEGGFGHTGI